MKIPSSFYLHGQRIVIKRDKELVARTDNVGEAHYRLNEIHLHQQEKGSAFRPKSQQEQSFFHELTHFILRHIGEYDINNNEKFVEGFSQLLHQALTTAEYKK